MRKSIFQDGMRESSLGMAEVAFLIIYEVLPMRVSARRFFDVGCRTVEFSPLSLASPTPFDVQPTPSRLFLGPMVRDRDRPYVQPGACYTRTKLYKYKINPHYDNINVIPRDTRYPRYWSIDPFQRHSNVSYSANDRKRLTIQLLRPIKKMCNYFRRARLFVPETLWKPMNR